MITQSKTLQEFEHSQLRQDSRTFEQKLALIDDMYELARLFGHFNGEQDLDGINHDIDLAKKIHSLGQANPH